MISGLREGKLSRNRKVKDFFFLGIKLNDLNYYLGPLLTKTPNNIIIQIGTNDAPYKNEDDIQIIEKHERSYQQTSSSMQGYIYFKTN